MRRSLIRNLHNLLLALAAIATAASVLMTALPARAEDEFAKERQLYMLARVELENARAMEKHLEAAKKRWAESESNVRHRYFNERATAGCERKPPREPERCKQIENLYSGIIDKYVQIQQTLSNALRQTRQEIQQRRTDFNNAVANYVAQVALQAAILPPQQRVRRRPPGRRPPVRRRPPNVRRAAPANSNFDRILSETQRRLQALQPTARGRR